MKKILIALSIVGLVCAVSFAADTLITGFDAATGIGTFKVVSDGTSATLTVDKLTVTSTTSLSGAGITGNIPKAAITNALGSAGSNIGGNIPVAAMTNALAGTAYTTNTLTGDGVTNVFIWSTVGSVKVLHSITTTP